MFLIIVPTLNSYKELNKLVISLKTQTFTNWRTIFIDGDSSLKHKNLLKSFCNDKRFSIVEEDKSSKGIYPSMSLGTKFLKKEEWVIFLGSDDWFNSPFSLEIINKEINNCNDANPYNLVIYGTRFIQKNNNKTLRINNVPKQIKITFPNLLFFGYMPMHQSACFSSELIIKFMPYNNFYKLAADCDLFLRISKYENLKIKFLKKILINIQSGGISSTLTITRIMEVFLIYLRYYGINFFIPFISRYFWKILSRFF